MVRAQRRLRWLAAGLSAAALSGACAGAPARRGPSPFPGAAPPPAHAAVVALPSPPPRAESVIQTALSALGRPYRLGGETPASGFDCSGLVRFALGQHRIEIPRTVAEQFSIGRAVGLDRVQSGDLVFFSTIGPGATHVGIVVAASGSRTFVHAPGAGAVVRIERFDTAYWRARFVGARRLF
jgi:cell wall-associated NlpC family hydrolase